MCILFEPIQEPNCVSAQIDLVNKQFLHSHKEIPLGRRTWMLRQMHFQTLVKLTCDMIKQNEYEVGSEMLLI